MKVWHEFVLRALEPCANVTGVQVDKGLEHRRPTFVDYLYYHVLSVQTCRMAQLTLGFAVILIVDVDLAW